MLKKLLLRLIFPHTYSNEAYVRFLRANHVAVGEGTIFYAPKKTNIDTDPWLIKIGKNCKITSGVTVLSHDYSVAVCQRAFGQFVGGTLPVEIGDNVFIGMNATILMGTTIGANCIVGANSLVRGSFPSNVVIGGNPAKIICTLEEFYKKNTEKWIENAKRLAIAIHKAKGDYPTIEEMSTGYSWLYLTDKQQAMKDYPFFFELSGIDGKDLRECFESYDPPFQGFDSFLDYCFPERRNNK